MVPDKAGVLKPAKDIKEILEIVPTLKEFAKLTLNQIENRDSTNINPNHWSRLALEISKIHNEVDGIIITHGTDTMAYTASAISLALSRGLKIPIVFTGSQLPLMAFGTDARFNLENSMKVIVEAIKADINEVMIVFSDKVFRANRAIKISESRFPAYDSPAIIPLAEITAIGVEFSSHVLKRDKNISFELRNNFSRGILAIDLVPGLNPEILMAVLESGKCHGLLLKSLGAGNVPFEDEYSLIPLIKNAITKYKIPVLVSTKFIGGRTNLNIYEPGKLALDAGAIPTGDMTDVMSQVKFMWALGQGYNDLKELQKVISTDFVGEITV